MPLTDEQKETLKMRRLTILETRIFELEMDRAGAVAAGEENAVVQIDEKVRKLKLAVEAIEKM
ncbi:hypothetical protein J19TS2_30870 [Cohnella xylanilytica]|uniref:hypothetical protein n=1 Tax=Cohnella xylanilytica TaxID=557555 RepID=UPI001B27B0FC|nr:hypothetical protein [Cohnella xylanilytica]GIO13532.1 hypothetical protein J19TS2_30870 [Cohnella xylanilytica]